MNREAPIVTDPVHLSTLAGQAVLCLRPTATVANAFHHVQRSRRSFRDGLAQLPRSSSRPMGWTSSRRSGSRSSGRT